MFSFYMFYEVASEQNEEEHENGVLQPKVSTKTHAGHTFSAAEAQKIIDANREKPHARTVVNINPKSATDLMSNSSNSVQQAANNHTNNSLNAGQRASSLTSGYVNKPQRVPGRLGINPTFNASTI